MKIIIKNFLILALFFSNSCSEDEPDLFYQKLDFNQGAKIYSPNDSIPPSHILASYDIVISVYNENHVFDIVIENLVGKLVYQRYYKSEFNSYAIFLNNLSNSKFSIPAQHINSLEYTEKIDSSFYGYVKKDDLILKEYSVKGFSHILKKHFTELGIYKNVYRYRLNLKDSTISYNAIYKIMYENKFIGKSDCVSGEISFFKFLN